MVRYQLLSGAEIRLLTILPGKPGDDMKCSLETVSLDDNPSYEAISYVWGDLTDRRDILVGDSIFSVTRNLFTALKRFRYTDRQRTLWADAVCINQEDLAERGRQVSLTGRVYSQCETCQVWLGEEDDVPLQPLKLADLGVQKNPYWTFEVERFSRRIEREKISPSMQPIDRVDLDRAQISSLNVPGAFRLLRMMAADMHFYEWPFYHITEFPKFELCDQYYNACRSLVNILSRPWWWRTWTVQEATLPQHVIVNIGVHSVELDTFLRAPNYINKHLSIIRNSCCFDVVRSLWHSSGGISEPTPFEFIQKSLHSLELMISYFRELGPNLPIGMAELIHPIIARNRRATDPLDAVYGYLGLFPSLLPTGKQPNYEESVASIYASSTKQHIYAKQTLDILRYVEPLSRGRTDLSSWAIDWLDQGERLWSLRSASGSHFPSYTKFDLFKDAAVLPIESAFIGAVAEVVNFSATDWESLDVQTITQTLLAFEKAAFKARGGKHDHFATWRTVYQDNHVLPRPKVKSGEKHRFRFESGDLSAIKAWVTSLGAVANMKMLDYHKQYGYDINGACVDVLRKQVQGLFRKRQDIRTSYCILDSGQIGTCARGVTPGDRVFVIKGLKTPVALRPVAEVEMQSSAWMPRIAPAATKKEERLQRHFSGRYRFLGCAYVDGIMDGQAVSEHTEWDLLHLV
ncbi:heterokaryon incompatibility protein-domain-containing protein [Xylaria arbuscula]|nr:heterokaryon incompatibility protein-domain-containing protein [Xylaria arbuscula]